MKLQAIIFALHKVLKNSACVTKNPKKAGDSRRYAGNREKGLKILRLPPNAGELTTMPLGSLSFFSSSVLHHKLLSPLLTWSFSDLPSHFPSYNISDLTQHR